jgi:hypothetical protein
LKVAELAATWNQLKPSTRWNHERVVAGGQPLVGDSMVRAKNILGFVLHHFGDKKSLKHPTHKNL